MSNEAVLCIDLSLFHIFNIPAVVSICNLECDGVDTSRRCVGNRGGLIHRQLGAIEGHSVDGHRHGDILASDIFITEALTIQDAGPVVHLIGKHIGTWRCDGLRPNS